MQSTFRNLLVVTLGTMPAAHETEAATHSARLAIRAEIVAECVITLDDSAPGAAAGPPHARTVVAARCTNEAPHQISVGAAMPAPFNESPAITGESARVVVITF